ncbi:MAG: NUDIX hydrolase [Methanocellales archaeon]|nr:NUDIX hydrolase [Methanocellales archaeon]MDD3290987.1 NUDIX hydrolase [Methanocellales archaeon]MDD5234872.1 NUDIX hydrolase [Methanocellales archaeon]MDD5484758.1 NUDIX hydrolase [Methanocellales archaeon]
MIYDLTVDAIILCNHKIVLIKRKNPPYENYYALPGGFVEKGETVEQALIREAKEETGLDVEILKLVGVYSDPNRDPRGRVVSLCYLTKGIGKLAFGSDSIEAALFDISELPELAFDHAKMIADAREYIDGFLSKVR